jgi:DNA-binding transcriptional ArsR family regulator
MVEVFAALGEPSRLRIVSLLRDGPRPVNDIVASLAVSQPHVSKHLRVLREARLVEVSPRGQQRLYALREERFHELDRWLESYRALWNARFADLDKLIDEMTEKESGRRHGKRDEE